LVAGLTALGGIEIFCVAKLSFAAVLAGGAVSRPRGLASSSSDAKSISRLGRRAAGSLDLAFGRSGVRAGATGGAGGAAAGGVAGRPGATGGAAAAAGGAGRGAVGGVARSGATAGAGLSGAFGAAGFLPTSRPESVRVSRSSTAAGFFAAAARGLSSLSMPESVCSSF